MSSSGSSFGGSFTLPTSSESPDAFLTEKFDEYTSTDRQITTLFRLNYRGKVANLKMVFDMYDKESDVDFTLYLLAGFILSDLEEIERMPFALYKLGVNPNDLSDFDLHVIGAGAPERLVEFIRSGKLKKRISGRLLLHLEDSNFMQQFVSLNSLYDDTQMPSFALPLFTSYLRELDPANAHDMPEKVTKFATFSGTCYRAGLRHMLSICPKEKYNYRMYLDLYNSTLAKLLELKSINAESVSGALVNTKVSLSAKFEIIRAHAQGLIPGLKISDDVLLPILDVFIRNSAMDMDKETIDAMLQDRSLTGYVDVWYAKAISRHQDKLAYVIFKKASEEALNKAYATAVGKKSTGVSIKDLGDYLIQMGYKPKE